ncbi:hypothetical protein PS639_03146 [Pseudomonas fluorescens]|nr:hypothetical protein PS639_03146 [Pseudomonas fluorescens]
MILILLVKKMTSLRRHKSGAGFHVRPAWAESHEFWSTLEKFCFSSVYHRPDLRMAVEGMLYRIRSC